MTKCTFLHPGICFILQKLGLQKPVGPQWRYVKGGSTFELIGIGDPDNIYSVAQLPEGVTWYYQYLPTFLASELMELIPDLSITRNDSVYTVKCGFFDIAPTTSNDITEALGYMLGDLISKKFIPISIINNKIKEGCLS